MRYLVVRGSQAAGRLCLDLLDVNKTLSLVEQASTHPYISSQIRL
jgi:hypothetical protein